jgi:colanic acid biosynthesis glycosyl transferase WcaI
VGGWLGRYYERMERGLLCQSDMVIAIAEDFLPLLGDWKVPAGRTRVIGNWAPLEELPVLPKGNPWSERLGLADKFCFLYAGILGYKHTPELFVQLASEFKHEAGVRVVVIAEGEAAAWLKHQRQADGLENLLLLPYQPASEFSQVLAAADVLLTVLNQDAGGYSVPSKVLSYLCAGRAQLMALAPQNLAARLVLQNGAGLVSPPQDTRQWLFDARRLFADHALRQKMGSRARAYAEAHFDIEKITDQFEEIIQACNQ